MLLSVDHQTLYRYDQPMRHVTQSHRLQPSRFDGQSVIDWEVSVEGGRFGASFVDGAGDRLNTLSMPGPLSELAVVVRGRVETSDTSGVLKGHRESINPVAYLRCSAATRADDALRQLASDALGEAGTRDQLDAAHRLSAAAADAIEYQPGVTHSHTTAAQALCKGRGVCQDHAHALIAMAVLAGLPARYVIGYLHSSADGAAHEASHAWAEVHVAGLGWVGFDVSNRCCPDERYIRLGSGLDALQAAPIRGVSRGMGVEAMQVEVSISAVGQDQQ